MNVYEKYYRDFDAYEKIKRIVIEKTNKVDFHYSHISKNPKYTKNFVNYYIDYTISPYVHFVLRNYGNNQPACIELYVEKDMLDCDVAERIIYDKEKLEKRIGCRIEGNLTNEKSKIVKVFCNNSYDMNDTDNYQIMVEEQAELMCKLVKEFGPYMYNPKYTTELE